MAAKKQIDVVRLVISAFLGFSAVLLLGGLLHIWGQDSKQWWLLLLPIWFAVSALAYLHFPWILRKP